MTNREKQMERFSKLNDAEFAEYLIFAYKMGDDNIYECPDGSEWYCYDDAVDRTAEWLGGEAE